MVDFFRRSNCYSSLIKKCCWFGLKVKQVLVLVLYWNKIHWENDSTRRVNRSYCVFTRCTLIFKTMAFYAAGKSLSNHLLTSTINTVSQSPLKKSAVIIKYQQIRTMSATLTKDAPSEDFPVASSITTKLSSTFQPTYLDVINESHMHNV